jgi:hypothetical protein
VTEEGRSPYELGGRPGEPRRSVPSAERPRGCARLSLAGGDPEYSGELVVAVHEDGVARFGGTHEVTFRPDFPLDEAAPRRPPSLRDGARGWASDVAVPVRQANPLNPSAKTEKPSPQDQDPARLCPVTGRHRRSRSMTRPPRRSVLIIATGPTSLRGDTTPMQAHVDAGHRPVPTVTMTRALRRASRRDKDGPDHLASHRGLLRQQNAVVGGQRFDAIVVPTGRSAENLLTAAAVARRVGKTLVILCSRASDPGAALDQVTRGQGSSAAPADVIVLDLRDYEFPVAFDCDLVARKTAPWDRDTATKRNVGLALARLMGWRSVLFLDDDVRELRNRQLRKGISLIAPGGYQAAGWSCTDFPDNSVVCHAYRLLPSAPYGWQTSFIGGGGLAVRTDGDLPFFPDVYNEDWFFLFDLLATRSVGFAGDLRQVRYDPFRPELAARQEFGDLLAEGLFRLLHRPGRNAPDDLVVEAQDEAFWRERIDRRARFIERIKHELPRVPPEAPMVADCLSAASAELERLAPSALTDWAIRWRRDVERWRVLLAGLPPVSAPRDLDALPRMLTWLNLDEKHCWPWPAGRAAPETVPLIPVSEMPHLAAPGPAALVRPDPHVHDEADASITPGLEQSLDLIGA